MGMERMFNPAGWFNCFWQDALPQSLPPALKDSFMWIGLYPSSLAFGQFKGEEG
jgi:hypothetical protein